jgi:ATP-binding cassette, subfamily B, bacterial
LPGCTFFTHLAVTAFRNSTGESESEETLNSNVRAAAWTTIRRLLGLAWRFRGDSVRVVLLHLAMAALGLSSLGLCGLAIDYLRHVLDPAGAAARWPLGMGPPPGRPPLAVVSLIALGVLFFAVSHAVVRYASAAASADLSQKILRQLRSDVYDKLQRLSFQFFDANQSSSLINRAAGDVQAVRSFVDGVVIKVFTILLTLGVYVAYMLNIHAGLTLACLATTPLLWLGAIAFSRAVQPAYRRAGDLVDNIITLLVENVHGVHVIKGFGREQQEIDRFAAAVQEVRQEREGIFWRISTFQPIMGALTQVNMLVLIGYGGYLVVHGSIPLGAGLFVMANLLHEFAAQVGNITNIANTIQSSLVGAERVFQVLDAPAAIPSPANPVPLRRVQGRIEMDEVSFGYEKRGRVLRKLSLAIEPGECIGITGETGAGKSTLLSLLPRFYDVSAGAVRIDGIDVRDCDLDALRRSIGLVFQETFLFSNTIAANIAFGRPEATREQIERAAQLASADQFIQEKAEGYETLIGEHGSNLSGGQRQRLALARALLLDPPILILDDALAAVDSQTEHEIQESLAAATRGRTTLIVSNRVSALQRTDRIIVMQKGEIVQQGTHDELIRRRGYYRRLVQLQFGDLLEEIEVEHPAPLSRSA